LSSFCWCLSCLSVSVIMDASAPSASCTGKGKGKGKAPPPPPPRSSEAASTKGKGKASPTPYAALVGGKDAVKSKGAGKAASSAQGFAVSCTAQLLDGRQLDLNFYDTSDVASIRAQVATKLHIGKHRVKLALGADVPQDGQTALSCGITDGAVLSVIVLTPVYGVLTHFGVNVPDDVIMQKLQLHEDLFASLPRRT